MPTKTQIIQALYESKEIKQAISKMQPAELRDDLRQEMFLVLCELPDDKVEDMHERNVLRYYMVRTMLNMMTGRRSSFEKKFRQVFGELREDWMPDDERTVEHGELRGAYTGKANKPDFRIDTGWVDQIDEEHHAFIDKTVKAVNELHFYEAGLLKLYAEHNRNAMEVSRKTNIPYRSVYPVIKEAKKKIQDKLKK